MDSKWLKVTLAEAGAVVLDCEHKTPAAQEKGIPYLAIPNVQDGRIDIDDVRLISQQDYEEWTRRTVPQAGDILLTRRGRVGDTAPIPSGLKCAIGQNLVLVRSNSPRLEQGYLRWALTGPTYREQVYKYLNVGAVFDSLNVSDIPKFEIPLPPLQTQRQIADILSAFDEKIELNRQMNRTLEQMARALFKSWFIDFDPVHAKQRGEQPADMDAETAALFPDRFEQIDGKEVPEGWRIGELADVIEFNPLLKLPKGADSTYLDMGSMPTQGASANGWFKRPFSSGSKYQNGDTLFARITPCLENGKAAFVDFLESNEVGWGSTEYIVMRPKSATPIILPYMLSRNENFRDFAIANMNGSSGRQRVSHQSLSRYPTVIPSREIFDAFERVTRPVLTFSKVARDESNRLAEIRDSLLPHLLSGELDVSDWENAVEAPEGAPA